MNMNFRARKLPALVVIEARRMAADGKMEDVFHPCIIHMRCPLSGALLGASWFGTELGWQPDYHDDVYNFLRDWDSSCVLPEGCVLPDAYEIVTRRY